ncbi:MAG TPA: DUF3224 domain-containing protein [Rhodanobacteraceae bacterium]|nr:DUF3224 domain-containing protein [Rhodanobacteraceae bacterium]
MMHARGDFEVKLAPLVPSNDDAAAGLGRMSIDKVFRGDLEAVSRGEMLSAGSPQAGSAGYVAIERVTGRLAGRNGSFTLQHDATMHRGDFSLNVIVVPGSGTDELQGLRGTMRIIVADGRHSYEFDYGFE